MIERRCAAEIRLGASSVRCELERDHEGLAHTGTLPGAPGSGVSWTDAVLSQDFDTDRPE